MWPFKIFAKKEDRISQLKETIKGLKDAQELLNARFEKGQMANAEYVKRAMKIREDLEKHESKLRKLEF